MDKNKQYFIYLVSCFLNNEAPKYDKSTSLGEIYKIASTHGLCEAVCQAALSYFDKDLTDEKMRSVFRQTVGLAVIQSEKAEAATQAVNAFLNDIEEDHIFVKGAVIREYYPVKEFRTSGDIDVIVRKNSFDKICNAVKGNKAFTVKSHKTDVLTAEINSVEVEFHNNADVDCAYFDDAFSLCEKSEEHLYRLDNYNHLLYVICHIAKHLSYCGAGIRMLADIDVLVRAEKDFDLSRLLELADRAGRVRVCEALLSLCAYWFKTPVKSFVDFSKEAELLESFESAFIDGGTFGYEAGAVPLRYINTEKEKQSIFDKIGVILKIAFPSREYLKKCYPYYDRNKLLYPAARINRVADCFKKAGKSKRSVKQVLSQSDSAKIQAKIMKELEIENNQ